MSTESVSRVVPQPDELTDPFWAAAAEGRFVIQQCTACGFYIHPPRIVCTKCHSFELTWTPMSGRGRVYTWTVMRMSTVAGFEDRVPYTTLLVELDEQPRLLVVSYLPGVDEELEAGQPVEVFFEPVGDFHLPQFRLIR